MTGNETLTRVRTVRDKFGDPIGSPSMLDIPACVIWPAGSSSEVTFSQDTSSIDYEVLVPVGTDVVSTDQCIWRSQAFEVVGTPAVYSTPFSATNPGLNFHLRRVTG